MKIWAKLMNGDKMLRDILFESPRMCTPQNFTKDLQEICYALDVSTPVSLPTHFKHFSKFNRIKYLPRDFIEDVDYTSLILEYVIDRK